MLIKDTPHKLPKPKISVIMPVYNGEKYLADAIDSVLSQTFTDFELFLVDDASTDNTSNIIAKYAQSDSRIIALTNKHTARQSEVRNRPIKLAQGEYIAIVDSDDVCMPSRFEKQLSFLEGNKNIHALGTDYCLFFGEKPTKCTRIISAEADDTKNGLPPVHNPTCMIRRSVFSNYGYYDSKFDDAEDVELWFRWTSQGVIFENIHEVLYKKRVHEGSVSISRIKHQTFLLLKINCIALFRYRIRMTLAGYLHILEHFLYLIYLTLRLDRVYRKNKINYDATVGHD